MGSSFAPLNARPKGSQAAADEMGSVLLVDDEGSAECPSSVVWIGFGTTVLRRAVAEHPAEAS